MQRTQQSQTEDYQWFGDRAMKAKDIDIKGIKDGIIAKIGPGKWVVQEQALLETIDESQDFFKGGRLYLDVGGRSLKAATLSKLRDALSEREIKLWAVLSTSLLTESSAQDLGMIVKLHKSEPPPPAPEKPSGLQGGDAVFYKRTIRSGHQIKHEGHVVIMGDVNPGGQIIAGGNIIVWGRLRGTVHAGAKGDPEAVVCALDLSPTQLRIADKISISPPQSEGAGPEIARLIEGQVVAAAWDE
jgi:septum site-determining protein MinC